VMVFRFTKKAPTDAAPVPVVFNDATTSTELIDGFVGAPSVYFAFAVPQDGILAPADFNASVSAYLKDLWKVGATAGTLTFDAASGYYTATLTTVVVGSTPTTVVIPDNAVMLTGGLGYSYSLAGPTTAAPTTPWVQPLTQTDVAGFPYDATTHVGGLIVPTPNLAKVATATKAPDTTVPVAMGTARRPTVDTAKCNACHGGLGVSPTFHVGQRNDGPTCSFCHTPNTTSSGWSAASKVFVHGVHGAGKRTDPFGWHQVSATDGFWQVTYPGVLNDCEQCHKAGTYDYSSVASLDALAKSTYTTVGAGTYAAGSVHAPYVAEGQVYGAAAKYDVATGTATQAADTTLVISPITTVCSACHDSTIALVHMEQNGGVFYQTRAVAAAGLGESCLVCHGKGKIAAIADVHAK
jgi:OmcA/MtrC family decaheme c-type cytochrome